MKIRVVLSLLSVAAAFMVAAPVVGDDSGSHGKAAKPSGLDRFKQLAGDWTGTMTDGGKAHDVAVKYTVTSAGSAVVETLGAGTPHEMVTVIHQDGKDLALTHYCAIGNQPFMKAHVKGDEDKVSFVFDRGSNMESDKEMHMHSVTFHFVDKDTLQTVWTNYDDGKPAGTATFNLKRKK